MKHAATISRTAASSRCGTAAGPHWDEALLRVDGYLRAHGLEHSGRLDHIAADILKDARAAALAGATGEPVKLAMDFTRDRIRDWLARICPGIDWTDERGRTRGDLALISADLPGRWSNYFLSAEPVPPELAAALASPRFLPGPELHFSHMPPAPLEVGSPDSDGPKLPGKNIWLPMRIVARWLLIGGFFGIAWAVSH